MGLKLPDLTVLWAARHGNKIRLGHLKANRFAIKIRDVKPTDVIKLRPVLAELAAPRDAKLFRRAAVRPSQ